ncbi:MAG: hypothetical protein KGH63_00010 [Candidatus Micrarchaeota archaeon]|nr:hypothetical protein [Candidatus Micrarchaeota archaeon]
MGIINNIFGAPEPVTARRILPPNPKRERYPTERTIRPVTTERVREWMKLKALDSSSPELSDSGQLAERCKEILSTAADPEVARITIRSVDALVEAYRSYKPRDDGTPAETHPLTLLLWGLEAGAEGDLAIALPHHDRPEDFGKKGRNGLKNQKQLMGELGLSDDYNGLLASAWWYMEGATHLPLKDENGREYGDLLKARLKTPKDFADPQAQHFLDVLQVDYQNYIKQVYGTDDVLLEQLKLLDTMHNTKSLRTMDPQRNFLRMYNTIWKSMITVESGKKLTWALADEILLGIEGGLERMQQDGIGRYELRRNWSQYWAHRNHKSHTQELLERRKVARTGPRTSFEPREQPYGGSKVVILFGPDNKDWIMTVGTNVKKEVPIEFEIPRYYKGKDGRVYEIDERQVEALIAKHLPPELFSLERRASLQLPVLGHFVMIWRVRPPEQIGGLVERLEHLPVTSTREANSLLEQGYDTYSGFIRNLERRLQLVGREAFKPSAARPVDIAYNG